MSIRRPGGTDGANNKLYDNQLRNCKDIRSLIKMQSWLFNRKGKTERQLLVLPLALDEVIYFTSGSAVPGIYADLSKALFKALQGNVISPIVVPNGLLNGLSDIGNKLLILYE